MIYQSEIKRLHIGWGALVSDGETVWCYRSDGGYFDWLEFVSGTGTTIPPERMKQEIDRSLTNESL